MAKEKRQYQVGTLKVWLTDDQYKSNVPIYDAMKIQHREITLNKQSISSRKDLEPYAQEEEKKPRKTTKKNKPKAQSEGKKE